MLSGRTPLWRQLAVVWGGALVLSAALLFVGSRRPYEFFWLLPYPASLASAWTTFAAVFREQPLLVSGTAPCAGGRELLVDDPQRVDRALESCAHRTAEHR